MADRELAASVLWSRPAPGQPEMDPGGPPTRASQEASSATGVPLNPLPTPWTRCLHPPTSAAGSGSSARVLTAAAVPPGPAPNSPVEEEGARPRPLLSSGVHIAGCEPDP